MKKLFFKFVRIAQKIFLRFGIRITRFDMSFDQRVIEALNKYDPDIILDVGANTGQFVEMLMGFGFGGRIISFEPSLAAHGTLLQKSSAYDNWEIAPRAAIGKEKGAAELKIANNSASSSLLSQTNRMSVVAPFAAEVASEKVVVRPLDDFIPKFDGSNVAIKIDTQGFESQVLLGATETLKFASVVIVELSVAELYEGQEPYYNIDKLLRSAGFELYDLYPGLRDRNSGGLLEYDAIYARA